MKKRNKTVSVLLPDGEIVKMELHAPTVREHNQIADRCNAIYDIVNSTTPDDPDPITSAQAKFVLRFSPEGSEYGLTEEGWRFW